MPPATPRLLDVDELTERIREQLSTPEFGQLFVKGEIQGLKHHPSGHVYFTLLGKNARVACALFRSHAERVLLWPKEGDEAAVQGRLDVYPPRGSYQLLASRIWPLGVGEQARAKELLREKLNQEGSSSGKGNIDGQKLADDFDAIQPHDCDQAPKDDAEESGHQRDEKCHMYVADQSRE